MKKLAGRRIVPMSHSVSEALEASASGTDGIRPFRSQALTLRLIVHARREGFANPEPVPAL
jgi:hypothetical protein